LEVQNLNWIDSKFEIWKRKATMCLGPKLADPLELRLAAPMAKKGKALPHEAAVVLR
jgi:hypothetical protein